MEKSTALPWVNLLFFILNTIITYISLTGVFGPTNTELSNKYQTLITPAGWAFSIWGFIFAWEGVFIFCQLYYEELRKSELLINGISYWWISACFWQCLWTIVFAQEMLGFAFVCMFGILFSLGMILRNCSKFDYSTFEYWTLVGPFQLHFGWITAAFLLSINVLLMGQTGCYEGAFADECDDNDVSKALGVAAFSLGLGLFCGLYYGGKSDPNPVSCGVLAWATLGMYAELTADDWSESYAELSEALSCDGKNTIVHGVALTCIITSIILWILCALGIAYKTFMYVSPPSDEEDTATCYNAL